MQEKNVALQAQSVALQNVAVQRNKRCSSATKKRCSARNLNPENVFYRGKLTIGQKACTARKNIALQEKNVALQRLVSTAFVLGEQTIFAEYFSTK